MELSPPRQPARMSFSRGIAAETQTRVLASCAFLMGFFAKIGSTKLVFTDLEDTTITSAGSTPISAPRTPNGVGSMLATTAERGAWTWCPLRLPRSTIGSRDSLMEVFLTSGHQAGSVISTAVTGRIFSPKISTDGSGPPIKSQCLQQMVPGSMTGLLLEDFVHQDDSPTTGRRFNSMERQRPVLLS